MERSDPGWIDDSLSASITAASESESLRLQNLTIYTMYDWEDQFWPQISTIFYSDGNALAKPEEIASRLAPVIQANPHRACVLSLVLYISLKSNEHPRDIAEICRVCVLISQMPEIWTMKVSHMSEPNSSSLFAYNLLVSLSEAIEEGLDDSLADTPPGNLAVESQNIRLTHAILCASSVKQGLLVPQSMFISLLRQGLKDPAYSDQRPEEEEITLICSCIVLSVVGKAYKSSTSLMFPGPDGLAVALRDLREKEILKSSSSKVLLERTIDIVEGDFKEALSENEAWDMLFP